MTNGDGYDIVFVSINGLENRFSRAERHFVLSRPAATDHTHSNLLHRWRPSFTTLAAFSISFRPTSRWVTIRTRSLSTGTARTLHAARAFKKSVEDRPDF